MYTEAIGVQMYNGDRIPFADLKARTETENEYDPNSTYALGEACTHEGKTYVANTAISTAEAWNSAHWDESNIVTLYNELNSNLSNLKGVSIDDKTLTDLGQMAISQGCFSYYCQGTMTGTLTKNDSSYIGFGLFFYHKANQIPCYTLYCINSSKAYMGRLAKSGNDYVIDMVKVSTYTNVN